MSPSRKRAASSAVVVGTVVTLAAWPPNAVAQEICADGTIVEVVVRTLDPYVEQAGDEDATFGWAFRALNWLHVETRESVIRWELLFDEGDCFDPLRLRETERILRTLPYLQDASVTSRRDGAGNHHVEVVAHDSWALSVGLGVDFDDGGVDVTGVQASYRNVLGVGLRASLFRRSFRERLRSGLLARHTNLFGSRVDAVVHGGSTRSGGYVSAALQKPFMNELARHAYRATFARRDDYFGYALPSEIGFSPAYLRYEAKLVELSYRLRLGPEGGRRATVGFGLSTESFDTPFGAEGTRAVVGGDFERTETAPTAVRDEIVRQSAPYSSKRMSVTIGVRDVRFDVRDGLDAIRADQDLLVGFDATLTVAPGFGTGTDVRSDVLVRTQGRWGVLGPATYLLTRFDVQGRRPYGEGVAPTGWRDVIGSVRLDAYWAQRDWASMYVRGTAAGGWGTDRPFQLRLGGREAVRAYSEDAFPGGRSLFVSAEQRFLLEALSPGFADVGAAIFVDAGKMWAGDAPFGRDTGWQPGVGAGFRLSPAGGRRVFRAELTLPLGSQRAERGIGVRLYGEIFGVLERRRWPTQVERSRWYGPDPDLTQRIADPLAGN